MRYPSVVSNITQAKLDYINGRSMILVFWSQLVTTFCLNLCLWSVNYDLNYGVIGDLTSSRKTWSFSLCSRKDPHFLIPCTILLNYDVWFWFGKLCATFICSSIHISPRMLWTLVNSWVKYYSLYFSFLVGYLFWRSPPCSSLSTWLPYNLQLWYSTLLVWPWGKFKCSQ